MTARARPSIGGITDAGTDFTDGPPQAAAGAGAPYTWHSDLMIEKRKLPVELDP